MGIIHIIFLSSMRILYPQQQLPKILSALDRFDFFHWLDQSKTLKDFAQRKKFCQ